MHYVVDGEIGWMVGICVMCANHKYAIVRRIQL